jgi:hypothetical protein
LFDAMFACGLNAEIAKALRAAEVCTLNPTKLRDLPRRRRG